MSIFIRLITVTLLGVASVLYFTESSLFELYQYVGLAYFIPFMGCFSYGLLGIYHAKKLTAYHFACETLPQLGIIGTLSGLIVAIKNLAQADISSVIALKLALPNVLWPVVFALSSSLIAYVGVFALVCIHHFITPRRD